MTIFVVLGFSPFLVNLTKAEENTAPVLAYPVNADKCIESREYMRAYHMEILNDWRDLAIRENARYATINGSEVKMSLNQTCMKCHDNKREFCDKCHNYLNVDPYCWDCHTEPEAKSFDVMPPHHKEEAEGILSGSNAKEEK
jgi:hypothetical protein